MRYFVKNIVNFRNLALVILIYISYHLVIFDLAYEPQFDESFKRAMTLTTFSSLSFDAHAGLFIPTYISLIFYPFLKRINNSYIVSRAVNRINFYNKKFLTTVVQSLLYFFAIICVPLYNFMDVNKLSLFDAEIKMYCILMLLFYLVVATYSFLIAELSGKAIFGVAGGIFVISVAYLLNLHQYIKQPILDEYTRLHFKQSSWVSFLLILIFVGYIIGLIVSMKRDFILEDKGESYEY